MKTVGNVLKMAADHLAEKGVPAPRRPVEEILCHLLKLPRVELYMQHDKPLEESELDYCREALRRLARHEPWQYVVGTVEFCGCVIEVNPAVLIPRQETELLVERMTEYLKNLDLVGRRFVDVCTGSGCIAIALKKRFPELTVTGVDISTDALEVACRNAQRNEVEIEWLEGDLIAPVVGDIDFLVSNPPYVTSGEYSVLERQVRDYEPKVALVAEEQGLAFYRRLAQQAPPVSALWLELGAGQGEKVKEIFTNEGWGEGVVTEDFGGHQRFFFLERV